MKQQRIAKKAGKLDPARERRLERLGLVWMVETLANDFILLDEHKQIF